MIKFPIATVSVLTLLAALTSGATTDELVRTLALAPSNVFFGAGDATNPACASQTPIEKNLAYKNSAFVVDVPGSCIMQGATITAEIPFSTTKSGPYPLRWDATGTHLLAPLPPSAFPAGSCRIGAITNPNGKTSNSMTVCR